jgi:hypothetical protein
MSTKAGQRPFFEGKNMREPTQDEKLVASAISAPLNLITGLADLLIYKGVISCEEMASILRVVLAESTAQGENEGMVKMLLEPLLAEFETPPPSDYDN